MISQAHAAEIFRSQKAGISPLPSVREVGLLAGETLRTAGSGRVVAVFDRSFYVAFGSEWICFGLTHIGSGPLHVLCESKPNRWPEVGDLFAVDGSVLFLDSVPFAALDSTSIWQPRRVPEWTIASLQRGLGSAEEFWQRKAFQDGLARAGCAEFPSNSTLLLSAAVPGITALKRIITHALDGRGSPERQSDLVTLIGLGPGLTPSGDDLLSGALIALASLGLLEARDELWRACRKHLDRTSDLSGLHLQTAAYGYGAAAIHDAIHATISGDVTSIPLALAAVSTIGHSSGRDSFAGVLIALRAAKYHFTRDQTRASAFVET